MFQRLLICTSLADGLQRFVRVVPSFAAMGVQQITFLHVVPLEGRGIPKPNETKVNQATEKLAMAQVNLPDGIEVQVEVQAGRVEDCILNTARVQRSDLVILGTESRSLLTEKLFGSTAVSLCQNNRLPILILRPQLISAFTLEELDFRCRHLFRYLLLPYDGSETSKRLIAQIQQQVKQHPQPAQIQECLLLRVIEDNDRIDKLMHDARVKEAETQLTAAKLELEASSLTVSTKIEQGDPVTSTLKAAMDYDITTIAIATATLGKLAELSSPSFTGELLRRSWQPVLFFPSA